MAETTSVEEVVIEDDPIEVRRAKREALIAAGKNPYWPCICVNGTRS